MLLNRIVPWHRLPLPLGLLNLEVFRDMLREKNLLATEAPEAPPTARPVPPAAPDEAARLARSVDGSANDLSAPSMGAVGSTFGRNIRPVNRPDLFDEPNAVEVSRQLLTRERFIPARSLNILAAAWIQFQVHDWVAHPRKKLGEDDVIVPLPGDMTWQNTPDGEARAPDADRRQRPLRRSGRERHGAGLRQHHPALVGRLGGLRQRRRAGRASCARARSCASRPTATCRPTSRASSSPASTRAGGSG